MGLFIFSKSSLPFDALLLLHPLPIPVMLKTPACPSRPDFSVPGFLLPLKALLQAHYHFMVSVTPYGITVGCSIFLYRLTLTFMLLCFDDKEF